MTLITDGLTLNPNDHVAVLQRQSPSPLGALSPQAQAADEYSNRILQSLLRAWMFDLPIQPTLVTDIGTVLWVLAGQPAGVTDPGGLIVVVAPFPGVESTAEITPAPTLSVTPDSTLNVKRTWVGVARRDGPLLFTALGVQMYDAVRFTLPVGVTTSIQDPIITMVDDGGGMDSALSNIWFTDRVDQWRLLRVQ